MYVLHVSPNEERCCCCIISDQRFASSTSPASIRQQPQAHQPYLLLVGASTARWTEAYNWFHCFFCTPWLWWPAAAPAINGTTMDQEVKESFLFHYLTFLMKTGQFNNLKVEYLKQLKKVGKVHKHIFRHRQKWLVKKGAMENVWWKKPIPHRHQE